MPRRFPGREETWSAERVLEANATWVSAVGLVPGALVSRRWLVLPAALVALVGHHALTGRYPALRLIPGGSRNEGEAEDGLQGEREGLDGRAAGPVTSAETAPPGLNAHHPDSAALPVPEPKLPPSPGEAGAIRARPRRWYRRWWVWILAVATLLLAVRLALAPCLAFVLRKQLDRAAGISGDFGDLSIGLPSTGFPDAQTLRRLGLDPGVIYKQSLGDE